MVHTFTCCGVNIAVDSVSGSVHVVDEVALDVINNFENIADKGVVQAIALRHGVTIEDVSDCAADVKELAARGMLFCRDTFRPDVEKLAKRDTVVKALCLHVAHTCNLDCDYCFAAQGKYHGERALMSFEVGKRALDFLVENSGSRHNLEVDFFGGEPLMNWETVKRLVAYGRKREKESGKHFRFTLTTNGMLVDEEVIDFTSREMDNVVMSLDGRKEVNDRFRKTAGGVGSFEIIVPKFLALQAARKAIGKEYYIRGTFTHLNPDFMKDIDAMLSLGFDRLSMEPVVCPPDSPYALTEEDLPVVMRQYELLAERMIEERKKGTPFVFYHYMLDLEHGPCIYKRLSGCGSGSEYLAVTPTGELYPCHQFVGEKDFLMGDLASGITRSDIREAFRSSNVFTRAECADCGARLWCAGGCAANSFHATGSIDGAYTYGCRLFKKRLECAIAVNASALLDSAAPASPAAPCDDCTACEP